MQLRCYWVQALYRSNTKSRNLRRVWRHNCQWVRKPSRISHSSGRNLRSSWFEKKDTSVSSPPTIRHHLYRFHSAASAAVGGASPRTWQKTWWEVTETGQARQVWTSDSWTLSRRMIWWSLIGETSPRGIILFRPQRCSILPKSASLFGHLYLLSGAPWPRNWHIPQLATGSRQETQAWTSLSGHMRIRIRAIRVAAE